MLLVFLCDITPDDIAAYQRKRLQSGAEGRTINLIWRSVSYGRS